MTLSVDKQEPREFSFGLDGVMKFVFKRKKLFKKFYDDVV